MTHMRILDHEFQKHPKNLFFWCVEDSNDAIMITDTQGKIFYVNKAWQRLYGFSTEEAVGNTPKIIKSDFQSEEFFKKMWRDIMDPAIGHWRGEVVNRTRDGVEIPVLLSITPYRDERGNIQGYMGIGLDNSERRKLENDVFQQNRLATIFYWCAENSNDTIMLTDQKGVLFYVNQAWQNTYGYNLNESIGKTPRILRSEKQGNEFYEKMWNDILNRDIGYWKGEVTNRCKNGREIPVLLSITPFRGHDGIIQGFMGIAVDISEKKRMEAQILQQDRLASVGLLASSLAHEIGTPLGVIRGRAEYLALLSGNQNNLKNGLEIIVAQIDRISKLIYSLLNLARVEKNEAIVPVYIARELGQVTNLIGREFRKNGIALKVEVPPEAAVMAERDRLEQVFLNLLMNSVHAIESAIGEGRREGHEISVTVSKGDRFHEIRVSDTGIGIPEKNMTNIFQPFFTTKGAGKGTGLGLAIIYRIISSWGGEIAAESVFGHGTTFIMRLATAH